MYTEIVFVGMDKDKILKSIRSLDKYPVKKIILVKVGCDDSATEDKINSIVDEIKTLLEPIFEVRVGDIRRNDIEKSVLKLVDMIKNEENVILNISCDTRIPTIIAYIAASATGAKLITPIPKYDENMNEADIKGIAEVPVLLMDTPRRSQKKIMEAIGDGVNSLDSLVYKINGDIEKSAHVFLKERARLSHHLSSLEKKGFVIRRRMGKHLVVKPTTLGKVMQKIMN